MNSVCKWLLVTLTIGASGGLAKIASAVVENNSINVVEEYPDSTLCDCLIVVACIVVIAVITTVSWRRSVQRRR